MGRVDQLIQSTKELRKLSEEAHVNTPKDNIRCIEAFDQIIFYSNFVMQQEYKQRFPAATMKELYNFTHKMFKSLADRDWVTLQDFICGEVLNYCDLLLGLFEKLKGVKAVTI